MKLSDIVDGFMETLPAGIVVGAPTIIRCLKKAVRFYAGYAVIRSAQPAGGGVHSPVDASDSIDGKQDIDLSQSEYAIIRPLFELYVEQENATHLEASRGLGIDVYGRTVSEISQEILQRELDMPKQAFMEPVFSV
jgi:hypothetical protein